jgi:hypothetical protein
LVVDLQLMVVVRKVITVLLVPLIQVSIHVQRELTQVQLAFTQVHNALFVLRVDIALRHLLR